MHFEPLRDVIRERAQALATSAGIESEQIAKAHIRKEDAVAQVFKGRGDHPGLVHILSAMEACQSYKPWHDKGSGKTILRPDTGKCLHYYFYFIDPVVKKPSGSAITAGSGMTCAIWGPWDRGPL